MILWMFLACSGMDVLPALAPPEAEVTVQVPDAKVDAGEPILVEVQAFSSEGWTVVPGVPGAEGLEVRLVSENGPVRTGDRTAHTWTYALTGEPGSYIIGTTEGHASGPGDQNRSFESTPIFVDIGVEGPTGGPMADFADVPPAKPPPWGWIAAGAAAVVFVALAIALALWLLRRRSRRVPPPLPPHVLAERAWAEALAAGLDDHALAVALSMVLRAYLEGRGGFPATAGTTTEILGHLEKGGFGDRALGIDDRMRMARILDATDRLKFAREGGGENFFAALDADFRAVLQATRPSAPMPTEAPSA